MRMVINAFKEKLAPRIQQMIDGACNSKSPEEFAKMDRNRADALAFLSLYSKHKIPLTTLMGCSELFAFMQRYVPPEHKIK